MGEDLVMEIGIQTLKTTALVASPMLVGALLIGLLISFLQAITQINEATLTFIPKMAVVALVLAITGPWMLDVLTTFTITLYENIANYVRY